MVKVDDPFTSMVEVCNRSDSPVELISRLPVADPSLLHPYFDSQNAAAVTPPSAAAIVEFLSPPETSSDEGSPTPLDDFQTPPEEILVQIEQQFAAAQARPAVPDASVVPKSDPAPAIGPVMEEMRAARLGGKGVDEEIRVSEGFSSRGGGSLDGLSLNKLKQKVKESEEKLRSRSPCARPGGKEEIRVCGESPLKKLKLSEDNAGLKAPGQAEGFPTFGGPCGGEGGVGGTGGIHGGRGGGDNGGDRFAVRVGCGDVVDPPPVEFSEEETPGNPENVPTVGGVGGEEGGAGDTGGVGEGVVDTRGLGFGDRVGIGDAVVTPAEECGEKETPGYAEGVRTVDGFCGEETGVREGDGDTGGEGVGVGVGSGGMLDPLVVEYSEEGVAEREREEPSVVGLHSNGEGCSRDGNHNYIESLKFVRRSSIGESAAKPPEQAAQPGPSRLDPDTRDAHTEWLSAVQQILTSLSRECDESLESESILSVAVRRGMTFPRPRWWKCQNGSEEDDAGSSKNVGISFKL